MLRPPTSRPPLPSSLPDPALRAILSPGVGITVWERDMDADMAASAMSVIGGPLFHVVAEGLPGDAAEEAIGGLPGPARAILPDIAALCRVHAALCGCRHVKVRLEHVRSVGCPRLHVDYVTLRTLCSYAGPGTDWQDGDGPVHRMGTGHVAVLKGRRWPGPAHAVLHRSPPAGRGRLLLCIDEADCDC